MYAHICIWFFVNRSILVCCVVWCNDGWMGTRRHMHGNNCVYGNTLYSLRTHAQLNLQTPSICAKYRYFSQPFITFSLSCDLLVFLVAFFLLLLLPLLPLSPLNVSSSARKMESVSYFNREHFFHPCGTNYSPRLNATYVLLFLLFFSSCAGSSKYFQRSI